MGEKTVIQASKRIGAVPRELYFCVSLFLILGSQILFFALSMTNISFELSFASLIITIILGFSVLGVWGFHEAKHSQAIQKWEKEIVSPFVNALPQEKSEILQLQIFLTPSYEQVYSSYYTRKPSPTQRKVQVTFIDNSLGLTTKEDYFEVCVDLEAGEKPFISYQYVENHLGFNMESGYYNPTIHLPKDYNFH